MREYCKENYKWKEKMFDLVYWASVGTVRKKLSETKRMQVCKIIHNWLPTRYEKVDKRGNSLPRLQRRGRNTTACPSNPNEDVLGLQDARNL